MYYQFPEEYFFPVVKKDDLDFLDAGYRQEEVVEGPNSITVNEDEVQGNEENIEINEFTEDEDTRLVESEKDEEVFEEVDEEYVEAEVEQHITSDLI
ncbi:hypothetical protein ACQPU1_10415 [Clostridium paraputrificum]|uniref:hypothetical protein n=1 Tax=Clostridium TaxID=1485 RepID=UPI003D35324D